MNTDTSTLAVPSDPYQRRHWIIYQLKLKGLSLADIAEEQGISRQAVSDALTGPSARIEQVISAKLGMTTLQLFPDRFNADGSRRHRSRQRRVTGAQS